MENNMSAIHSYYRYNGDKELKNNNYRRSRSKHQKSHSPLPMVKIQGRENSARHHDRKHENGDYYKGERTNSRANKNEKNHQITKKKQYRDDSNEHQKTHHKHFHEKKNKHYHYHHYEKSKKESSYEKSQSKSEDENSKNHPKSSDDGKDRTKDEGHYKYEIGEIINTYKIVKHLSDGTFGRVFEVINLKDNKAYAMKMIRAVERYVESAKTEVEILLNLQKRDPEGKFQIVKLTDAFEFKRNYCMVFEKLGLSLYELLKKNDYRGYPIELIQSFLRQILKSIGFLHKNKLTHTDLKPENILLAFDEYHEYDFKTLKENNSNYKSDHDDKSSTCSKTEKKTYYLPKSDLIKIIDFGGATYDYEHHSSVINTRQYRAPEIILSCCKWDHSSDLWCIACIIVELYSGELLFETHESYEHLAMIEKVSGHIPYWMCKSAERSISKHFNFTEEHYKKKQSYFDWPKYAKDTHNYLRVKNMKTVKDIISKKHKELADLLLKMLKIDPTKRIDCEAALEHPFFSINYKNFK